MPSRPPPPRRSRPPGPPPPAKLTPPRLTAVLARPRLFKLLDQAARRPVIWIEGPAGSGKTTLAASWLARRGDRSLWYQLDLRDRDPATFFYFLREGVRRLAPRRREPLPLLTPEYLPGIATYARNFFDEVFERLGSPGVLVLDDFQELPAGAALHRLLPEVLACVPEGIHVVVLSRAAPPQELARLRANSLFATVGWDALRFTLPEAAALLAEHGLPPPGSCALAGLYEEADGWAAGLVLIGEAARHDPSPERRPEDVARRRPTELFEYFASELFDRAEPAAQRVLLATAMLPAVTVGIAEQLAGSGAGARLERLARDNFFTTRRTGGEPVYQYHPLFRAFLRARAELALAPAERATLRRRAAAALDEAGRAEDGVALLLDTSDGEGAAALIQRLAPSLKDQGRIGTLEAWIRALPAGVREEDPWMLLWLGACRQIHDVHESVALYERAFGLFQARGDDPGSVATATRAVEAILTSFRGFTRLDPWLRWLEERARRGRLPSAEAEARVTGTLAAGLFWRSPSHPDVGAWHERLAALLEGADSVARARGLMMILWYRAWTGDQAAVRATLAALERAARAPEVPAGLRIIVLHMAAAAVHFGAADPDGCLKRIDEGLRLGEREGIHTLDHFLHAHAARTHLGRGDRAAALPHLEALRATAGSEADRDGVLLHLTAWDAFLRGDVDEPSALVRRALRATEEDGITQRRLGLQHALAQLTRARGDRAGALRELAAAEETAAAERCGVYVWACRLLRAQLALDEGDRPRCRTLLAAALAEGRAAGYTNIPWASTATALAGLCEEALDAGLEPAYVRELIRLHGLAPDPDAPGAARWPFPVSVHALGAFAVERGDGRREGRLSGRSKPLELLKALVALGGRDVPEGRIVELLWPDAEGDRARQRLKFTLFALRRSLGPAEAVLLDKGLLSLSPRVVHVDAWDLERQLVRLAAAVERARPGETVDALARAVALHRGPLLEDEAAPWAAAARDRLEARFLRLAVQATKLLREHPAARPLLERVQELFPHDRRLPQALARASG